MYFKLISRWRKERRLMFLYINKLEILCIQQQMRRGQIKLCFMSNKMNVGIFWVFNTLIDEKEV